MKSLQMGIFESGSARGFLSARNPRVEIGEMPAWRATRNTRIP
jgi:hypothetical protein